MAMKRELPTALRLNDLAGEFCVLAAAKNQLG
jgi:hypothetical protein